MTRSYMIHTFILYGLLLSFSFHFSSFIFLKWFYRWCCFLFSVKLFLAYLMFQHLYIIFYSQQHLQHLNTDYIYLFALLVDTAQRRKAIRKYVRIGSVAKKFKVECKRKSYNKHVYVGSVCQIKWIMEYKHELRRHGPERLKHFTYVIYVGIQILTIRVGTSVIESVVIYFISLNVELTEVDF